MTTRYVDGANGNNAWDGLSPVFVSGTNGPKATLNGAEDTPVVAGDLVHVRGGTYRELLTCDVSGTAGNAIEYRGDYAGLIWPSSAGVPVRITGSDNDQTATRANCITATSKNHRTFQGLSFDTTTLATVNLATSCSNWIIQDCFFQGLGANASAISVGGTGTTNLINKCFFGGGRGQGALFTHTVVVDNAGHIVQNCIFNGLLGIAVRVERVGGITVKNNLFLTCSNGVRVVTALTAGQTVTCNNNIIAFSSDVALRGTAVGEVVEDYNSIWGNVADRTNVTAGANSNTYSLLNDPRWFFQMVTEGAGPNHATQLVTPFDLASFSALLNVAGTSPPSTDMRGTAVQGAQREWGALEYDSTLKIEGGAGGAHSIFGLEIVR